jgi:hypothetical protein
MRFLISRQQDQLDLLFLPLHCSGFVPSRVQEVQRGSLDRGMIRVSAPAPYEYSVVSHPTIEHQGPLCVPMTDEQRERCLEVPPEISAEVHRLAEEIAGALSNPRDRVRAVEQYLNTHHSYSLETDPGRGDPVSNFLLQRKAAHCEYFASAACILLRCVDVPTRFVSGFYAHEPTGWNSLVVRQQDAHAWAESWIDGFGWVTVDATPPESGRPDSTSDSPPLWRRAWEWLNETALVIGDWFYERSWAELGLLIGGAIALIVSLLWLREVWLRRRRRRLAAGFAYRSPGEALKALKDRFERLLAKRGLPCPEHLPWSEHLAVMAKREKAGRIRIDLEKANGFARAYREVRFGRPEDGQAIAALERELRSLERAGA